MDCTLNEEISVKALFSDTKVLRELHAYLRNTWVSTFQANHLEENLIWDFMCRCYGLPSTDPYIPFHEPRLLTLNGDSANSMRSECISLRAEAKFSARRCVLEMSRAVLEEIPKATIRDEDREAMNEVVQIFEDLKRRVTNGER